MIRQLLECDGCGAQCPASERYFMPPDGWRLWSVANIGRTARGDSDVLAVCPECWGTKTLAEVLGS